MEYMPAVMILDSRFGDLKARLVYRLDKHVSQSFENNSTGDLTGICGVLTKTGLYRNSGLAFSAAGEFMSDVIAYLSTSDVYSNILSGLVDDDICMIYSIGILQDSDLDENLCFVIDRNANEILRIARKNYLRDRISKYRLLYGVPKDVEEKEKEKSRALKDLTDIYEGPPEDSKEYANYDPKIKDYYIYTAISEIRRQDYSFSEKYRMYKKKIHENLGNKIKTDLERERVACSKRRGRDIFSSLMDLDN